MSEGGLILDSTGGRCGLRWATVLAAAMLLGIAVAGPVSAQEEVSAKTRRAWLITPSVSVKETYSDNANISSADKRSDWITEIGPGIRIDGQTARLKLYVDYRLRNLIYANNSRGDQVQHSLNSFGKLEVLENLLFVDVSANIMRQQISALGSQSAANYSVNNNNTEQRTFRMSPYLQGRLAGFANYELRYSDTRSRSDSAAAPEADSSVWSGRISGATPMVALGWALDADDQRNEYIGRRTNDSDHWRGALTYAVSPQFLLSVDAGRERNNYLSSEMKSYSTHGFGFEWRPTERTRVSGNRESRFFGNGHAFLLSHRFARSALKYSDSRDVMVMPPQTTLVGLGTYFDLFSSILASQYPDETERALMVQALLATYGLSPNAIVTTDFINAQATVKRRQELSYAIQGARNVVTFSISRSLDERLGTAILVGVNDFSTTSTIRQRGFNASWSHKLSALSSVGLSAGYLRSLTDSDADIRTTHKNVSATITTRLGAKTQGSLTARRTEYDSPVAPYTEHSLAGMVTVEF